MVDNTNASVTEAVNPTAGSILGVLASFGDLTGWDIDQVIETSVGNFWNVTRSQIYRELHDLSQRGLVVRGTTGPRSRTPYQITDLGRAHLAAWLAEDPGPTLIRNRLLLTVFFSGMLERGRFEEILRAQHDEHRATLARYRATQAEHGTQGVMLATLRLGISIEEATLSWIESLLEPGAAGT